MSFYKRVTLTLFYYLIKGKISFIIDKYTKEGTIHNSAYAFYANFWTLIVDIMLTNSYADNFLGPPLGDSQHPSDKKFQTASILAPLSM